MLDIGVDVCVSCESILNESQSSSTLLVGAPTARPKRLDMAPAASRRRERALCIHLLMREKQLGRTRNGNVLRLPAG